MVAQFYYFALIELNRDWKQILQKRTSTFGTRYHNLGRRRRLRRRRRRHCRRHRLRSNSINAFLLQHFLCSAAC